MSWNYRVIRTETKDPSGVIEVYHGIHEVYYNEDGSLWCYSEEPVCIYSEDGILGLAEEIGRMKTALDEPVLVEQDFPRKSRDA